MFAAARSRISVRLGDLVGAVAQLLLCQVTIRCEDPAHGTLDSVIGRRQALTFALISAGFFRNVSLSLGLGAGLQGGFDLCCRFALPVPQLLLDLLAGTVAHVIEGSEVIVELVDLGRLAADAILQRVATFADARLEDCIATGIAPSPGPIGILSQFGCSPVGEAVGPLGSEGQLYADFSARFADAYVRNGGNESAAADFAAKQIAQKWAPSVANGGRIMANPPEKYFPQVDGSYDWIRTQLDADVAAHFGIKPGTSEVAKAIAPVAAELYSLTSGRDLAARMPPRNYGLVADQTTEAGAAAKKAPTYRVVVEADDGTWHLLEQAPGDPLRFMPDLDKAQAPVNAERQRRDADQRSLARIGKPLSLEERDEASPYKLP
jgi:hypothetical protein